MPRNSGLSLGSGIADGVSLFTQAFFAARQQKNALELTKNDRLANLLLDQIKDDNTPHSRRTALIDEYQKLYEKNPKVPLSQILGLHKLDDQDYNVGQPSAENKAATIASSNINNGASLQDAITTGPPPNPSEVTFAPVAKKYGDVTPNEVKQKLQLDLESVRDQREIAHAKELYKAQTEILGKNGYTIPVSEAYDPETKTYRKVYANSAGETKEIKLENFKPTNLAKAEITAQSQSDKPSVFVRDQIRYWQTQVNPETGQPFTQEEAKVKAVGDAHRKFTSTESLKEAQTTALNYGNEGTKPIQPAQAVDDTRAQQQMRITLQQRADSFYSQSNALSIAASKAAYDLTDNWNNNVQPAIDKLNGLDPDSDEYKAQQNIVNRLKAQHNLMKAHADLLVKQDNELKKQVEAANKALQEFDSKNGNPTANKDLMTTDKANKAIEKYRPNIDQFKKDNPSSTMSDVEIINYLRGKKVIK